MLDKISELREKERKLLMENSVLREEYKALPLLELATAAAAETSPDGAGAEEDEEDERQRHYMEVETELVIGRPGSSS
ncbi:MIKC-type MADS-box transcription factor AGL1 [Hordeum vulgare]|nr:MIKC-type MADS-box transcription factor AGL1 [Hordeum vulgare]